VREIVDAILSAGEPVAVATVVATQRSAPRPVGAKLVVTASGGMTGSVSGGCVEADVAERARAILGGAPPELVHYGIDDDQAWTVGLACGGELDVFIERADPEVWRDVRGVLDAHERATLVTDLATGEQRLESADARARDGEFAEPVGPPLQLVVFGATDVAEHLCAYASRLGWRTLVIDPRGALATPERVPSADEVVVAWPDDAADRIDEHSAVVSLTHEERLDVPALAAALERGAWYVGALGAKRTQAKRREALASRGFADAELDRISGPAGLPLGSREPAEMALAIAGEIVALRNRVPAATA
jgi:xanthine dehydrogenase accessory factor